MPRSTIEEARKLAALSSDCSFLLTHLIRHSDNDSALSPEEKLKSILSLNDKKPMLNANPVGWYGSASTEKAKIFKPYTDNQFVPPRNIKGVCFTESTLAGLKAHRDVFSIQYGLAFDRDFLFCKGANPCLNIQESILTDTAINSDDKIYYKNVHNFIPDQLAGFVNIIHESFDATHEREWRILGDFEFNYSEIKFIFCPEKEFKLFSKFNYMGCLSYLI